MFFARKLPVAAPWASRTRAEGRSPRRRPAALRLETLEGRDLKTVAASYGLLSIQPDQASGSTAVVERHENTLRVTLDGQTFDFDASEIHTISYVSGYGGWNTFKNNTDLYSSITAMGDNNTIQGGSGFNIAYLVGDNSSYDSLNGMSYVFTYNAPHSRISTDDFNISYHYTW
jgi:hypothetical protein